MGDAWEPARKRFCGDKNPMNIPIALVIFGDKSHLDLHGCLLTLPIIFTLTCFNQDSRIKKEFWRPLAFLPNLSYGALVQRFLINHPINAIRMSMIVFMLPYLAFEKSTKRVVWHELSWGSVLLERYGFTFA
jgi:hypothetical protein